MTGLLSLLKPLLPLLLQKESRNGLLLISVILTGGLWITQYVDAKHNQALDKIEKIDTSFREAFKEQNKEILDEIRLLRAENKETQRNVLRLYRDAIIFRKRSK